MNGDSSGGTMTIIGFYFINQKRNWAHLAEKNSQAGSKITTIQAIMKILYQDYHKNNFKIFDLI